VLLSELGPGTVFHPVPSQSGQTSAGAFTTKSIPLQQGVYFDFAPKPGFAQARQSSLPVYNL